MKKMMISTLVASALAFAGGDIAPVEPVVYAPTETVNAWEFEGQIYKVGGIVTLVNTTIFLTIGTAWMMFIL